MSPHIDRLLWRAATQIHTQLEQAYRSHRETEPPYTAWKELLRVYALREEARAQGWRVAAHHLNHEANHVLSELTWRLETLRRETLPQAPPCLPALGDVYRDLIALEDEFAEVHCQLKQRQLSVDTDPICLEEVDLGRFQITLHWGDRTGLMGYSVTALDPHPAANNSQVPHPHVHGETLCEGDGRVPIQRALEQGRIYDLFLLIRQILDTYNASSAYVSLDRWTGADCDDCGAGVRSEDIVSCSRCSRAVCEGCITICRACEGVFCSDCRDRCPGCEEPHCLGCLDACPTCRAERCPPCRNERQCNCPPPAPREHADSDVATEADAPMAVVL